MTDVLSINRKKQEPGPWDIQTNWGAADGSTGEDGWTCEFTGESMSRQRMKGAEGLIAVYGLRLDCPLRGANRPHRYSEGGGGGGETLAAAGG